jgi:hypothetical protein
MIPVLISASGCATSSHKTLTLAQHAAIHSVSISKSVAIPEYPMVVGPSANTAAMLLGPLALAGTMTSENEDSQKLEKLFSDNNFDIGDVVRTEFVSRLSETHAFPKIDVERGDAVFDLTIKNYGAVSGPFSPMSPINPPIRPQLIVTAKLSTPNGEVLWQNTANLTRVNERLEAYPFVDMLANPGRTVNSFREAARLVVAEVLRELGAHPSEASQSGASLRIAVAQGAAGSSTPLDKSTLVAPGVSWVYEFTDKIYTDNDARITVRVIRAADGIVEEQLSARSGAARTMAARREIDARAASFDLYRLGANEVLTEFAPYLFAAGSEKAVRGVTDALGYPTGGNEAWNIRTAAPVWDVVTVPAGTFRAMRLEIDGKHRAKAWDITKFSFRVWYAPQVGRYVKYEHQTWRGDGRKVTDEAVKLVAFNPRS